MTSTPPDSRSHVPPAPDADPGASAEGVVPEAGAPGGSAEGAGVDEVALLKASLSTLEDRLRRQQADFLNDVARIRRQAEERAKFAVQPVVEDLLGVTDALHKAIEGLTGAEHEQRVAQGLRLVEKELLDVLGRYGVARIEAEGKPFDHTLHEAILEVEGTTADRRIVQVVRPGFTLHGRLVRPARVVVSRPPASLEAPPPAIDDESDA